MKSTWPSGVARRIGLSGEIQFTPTRVGLTLHIPCGKGAHLVDFEVPPGCHPDQIAKRMLGKGWTFGSKLTCPEHSRREKRARSAPITLTEEPAVMATTATSTSAPPTPSEAARKAKRLIYQFLEDFYDDQAKAYRPGHSDESIAKETGAAVAFVREIREADFGPIGEPPEVRAIRTELAALRDAATEVQNALGSRLNDLDARSAKLSDRLAALCRARGWPEPV